MPSLLEFINRLLPFATPGTPLAQDVIHLAVICVALYFAPQIQEYLQRRRQPVAGDAEYERHGTIQTEAEGTTANQHQEGHVGAQDNHADQDDDVIINDNQDFHAFQAHQAPLQNNNEDENNDNDDRPGPENRRPAAAAAAAAATARNVGAKKAKSLARKDQRRAYHEFQRVQGDALRAQLAEGASEREAQLAAERERRKAAEEQIAAQKAKERQAKREQEEKERSAEMERREVAVAVVRRELEETGMSCMEDVARAVGGVVGGEWVERIVRAAGIVGGRAETGTMTMVTSTGWIVRVRQEDMLRLYQEIAEEGVGDQDGKIGFADLGKRLEAILRKSR